MTEHVFRRGESGRLWIAQREHHVISGEPTTSIELHLQRQMPFDAPDVGYRSMHDFQSNIARRAQFRGEQHLAQIFAIKRSRQKILAGHLGHASLRELQEFLGRGGIRRHAARRNIEQIGEAALCVGSATGDFVGPLDQHESSGPRRRTAQQIRGHQGAAESAANNHYGPKQCRQTVAPVCRSARLGERAVSSL